MNLNIITNDPIGPALKAFGLPFTLENQTKMRCALEAALPYLVAKRDAEIARLAGPVQKLDGQDDALRETLAQAQAEIARLHDIIRKIVRLSPDNLDVEEAALGILEKPYDQ